MCSICEAVEDNWEEVISRFKGLWVRFCLGLRRVFRGGRVGVTFG